MKRLTSNFTAALTFISVAAACLSCSTGRNTGDFTGREASRIMNAGEGNADTMRVLTINDSTGLAILRSPCTYLSEAAISSSEFSRLSELMINTVTHPSQDGVGIAAPQVGINRRVIAVQRFDKPGNPFETYANIRIIHMSDSTVCGREGCLSVPDMYGYVERAQQIVIEYADLESMSAASQCGRKRWRPIWKQRNNVCGIPVVRDTISGFTAVIFQHEADHLDGILYTDRAVPNHTESLR